MAFCSRGWSERALDPDPHDLLIRGWAAPTRGTLMPRQAARRLARGRVYRAPEALRGRSITLVDGGVLHAYWRASARALAAVHASRLCRYIRLVPPFDAVGKT